MGLGMELSRCVCFCMSVGEGGTEWVNGAYAYMFMHFTCTSKTNANTHTSRIVINAFTYPW